MHPFHTLPTTAKLAHAGSIQQSSSSKWISTAHCQVRGACEVLSWPSSMDLDVRALSFADEKSMVSYVLTTGPLSVCLDASTWSTYTGGIMASCGTMIDHCVQAVGVDTGKGFWTVRNSWGVGWGEDGFIRLKLGQDTCAIANDPTYVAVSQIAQSAAEVA
mmetsp:Transcript_154/g.659  ORF Transcript_154/g.659 Transcript_154/m.659 type:complete len:161 (-) Transcript_154:116-598(-)|eukprot:scaffold295_cov257-Pinguiococcus_pyrenoidosus.AAC.15